MRRSIRNLRSGTSLAMVKCGPDREKQHGSCFRRSIRLRLPTGQMKTCAASDSGYGTARSNTSQEATFQARRIRVFRLGTELNPLLVQLLGESTYMLSTSMAQWVKKATSFFVHLDRRC